VRSWVRHRGDFASKGVWRSVGCLGKEGGGGRVAKKKESLHWFSAAGGGEGGKSAIRRGPAGPREMALAG